MCSSSDQEGTGSKPNFRVYVRERPQNRRELKDKETGGKRTFVVEKNTLQLSKEAMIYEYAGKSSQRFTFDQVFTEHSKNSEVFEGSIAPVLPNLFEGFNVTCMAYGITGAGKTFTMLGNAAEMENPSQEGVSVMSIKHVFEYLEEARGNNLTSVVKMSYLEVYNECLRDLLNPNSEGQQLTIIEDPKRGIVVPGLKEHPVDSAQEALKLILSGNKKRTMSQTKSNEFSSRSHAVIQVMLERKATGKQLLGTRGKLSIVDLAGSEKESYEIKGAQQRMEGGNINRSLLALASCIKILTEKGKKKFVPYRDSKLTRLLKDSLGGNAMTVMIACVTSSFIQYDETVNTLKYASQARKIKNPVKRNITVNDDQSAKFKLEIQKLREVVSTLQFELTEVRTLNSETKDEPKEKAIV